MARSSKLGPVVLTAVLTTLLTIGLALCPNATAATAAAAQQTPSIAVTASADAERAKRLIDIQRIAEALTIVERIVESDARAIEPTFTLLQNSWLALRLDRAEDYSAALRRIDDLVRRKLPDVAPAAAPRVAQLLVGFETQVGLIADGQAGMRAVMDQYPGTDVALEIEVDLLIGSRKDTLTETLQRLDDFARSHPGTTAAAKALYRQVIQLSHNVIGPDFQRYGDDPADRLLHAIGLVAELENGTYPPNEWADKAVQEVVMFGAYRQTYAPANVERVLAAYRAFVLAHYPASSDGPISSSMDYIITTKIANVASPEEQNARVRVVEQLLDELEKTPARASRVRYLRSVFYLLPGDGNRPSLRDRYEPEARAILAGLVSDGQGDFPRAALWRLVGLDLAAGRHLEARSWLQTYVDRYAQTPGAWIATFQLGQTYEATNDLSSAIDAYQSTASRYADELRARTFGHVSAARLLEGVGRLAEARAEYQAALDGWDDEVHQVPASSRDQPFDPSAGMFLRTWQANKPEIRERIAKIDQVIAMPGSALLEQGRWLLTRSRNDEAVLVLQRLLKEHPGSAAVVEGRTLLHTATLESALAVLSSPATTKPQDVRARERLEELNGESLDAPVFAAKVALACLDLGAGQAAAAERRMNIALLEWQSFRKPRARAALSALEKDVYDIRDVVFRPRGGGVYGTEGWNAFDWPSKLLPFVVVAPDVSVVVPGADATTISMPQTFSQADSVLFLNGEEYELLIDVMDRIGGTLKRAPQNVMDVPNQPIGPSLDILDFWNKFFDARPGHWGGWELMTYPASGGVTFLDAERTKATVAVSIGYAGATVVLEKADGTWRAVKLVNLWVT